jgi:hypothetical protein
MKLSFAEIDSQHVELLPARTVMSMFILGNCCKGGTGGGTGGGDACVVSIGGLAAGVGAILGAGTATATGNNSC